MMLKSHEIIKVLDNLIGPTGAIGDSNVDERRYERLEVLIDVTNWCLNGVQFASSACGRPEGSMHKIGWGAKCALDEWHTWLGEVLSE